MGPGKLALLESIGGCGSITRAARQLGMSYRRAWLLTEALNQSFQHPLVHASHGGRHGGGATLTDTGERVLVLYRAMEAKATRASQAERREIERLLHPSD